MTQRDQFPETSADISSRAEQGVDAGYDKAIDQRNTDGGGKCGEYAQNQAAPKEKLYPGDYSAVEFSQAVGQYTVAYHRVGEQGLMLKFPDAGRNKDAAQNQS